MVIEKTLSPEDSRYIIVKYIRLSTEDSYNDSMSIENQRLMLDKYIADIEIPKVTVLDFVDNGYSGTNFERPSIQELLELVRAGKVNCVVVKDFSRFGRNAIETGYFLERVFPLYRTRFISVCDNYDSNNHEGSTGGIEVALKFLVHEQYSLDLSKKIKAAKAEKARRGEYITKNCAFGYVKTMDNRLDIDPVAADTVRLIFALASGGKRSLEIAKILYEQKRLPPAAYRKCIGNTAANTDSEYIWNLSTVTKILHNEQYTGTYVAGKTRMVEVGSRNPVKLDEREWIRIPNHHPAIVSEDLFSKVQATISGRRRAKKDSNDSKKRATALKHDSPLRSKVVCGGCGHLMALNNAKNATYRCEFTRSATDMECHELSINCHELEKAIFEIITKQAQVILGVDSLSEVDAMTLSASEHTGCRQSIERLHDAKCTLYERYTLEEIDVDEYKEQKKTLDTEIDRLSRAFAILSARLSKQRHKADSKAKLREVVSGESQLSQSMIDVLIENVRVYPSGRVEIVWKMKDDYSVMTNGEGALKNES